MKQSSLRTPDPSLSNVGLVLVTLVRFISFYLKIYLSYNFFNAMSFANLVISYLVILLCGVGFDIVNHHMCSKTSVPLYS